MIIHKTHKYRLYPTNEQEEILLRHAGCSRFIWNKLVEKNREQQKNKEKLLTQSDCNKLIVQLKKENEFLKEAHSQPMQINAQRIAQTNKQAFRKDTIQARKQKIAKTIQEKDDKIKKHPNYNYEKALAKALNYGFPSFHSKKDKNDSLFYPQNFKICRSRIYLAKIGWIKYRNHRKLEGKAKTISIIQDGTHWYVAITCEVTVKEEPKKNLNEANIVGVDLGIKTFCYCSDGIADSHEEVQKKLKKLDEKIAKKQESIARKKNINQERNGKTIKVPSNSKQKELNTLHKLHRRKRNIKKDFLHKLSHHMISKYDGIILEDLGIQELIQKNKNEGNKQMVKEIHLASWYSFGLMLEYKSLWSNKYFHKTNRFEPTTQTCSNCESKKIMKLSDRIYCCDQCGLIIDRDYNSSIRVKDVGIKDLQKLYSMERGGALKTKRESLLSC